MIDYEPFHVLWDFFLCFYFFIASHYTVLVCLVAVKPVLLEIIFCVQS